MNMAQAIAQALHEAGVTRSYGLPGGENVELLEALRRSGMDFVLVHNESSALYMAAAAARLEGRPGVCLTTLGPGLANAMAGLGHAWLDRAPLLLLTAQVPATLAGRHTHQLLDQLALTRPLVKAGHALRRGEDAGQIVRDLLHTAVSGRPGPVHLQLSRDVAASPAGPAVVTAPFTMPVPAPPDLVDLERAQSLWRNAQRPLILVGLGIELQGCHDELPALAEASQAPVITTPKAKGAIPGAHPLAAGTIGLTRADPVYELLDEADCLLAIGFDAVELVRPWEALTPRPPLPPGEGELSVSGFRIDKSIISDSEKSNDKDFGSHEVPLPEGRAPVEDGKGFRVRAGSAPLIWLAPWENEDPQLPAVASFSGDMAPVLQRMVTGLAAVAEDWGATRVARFRRSLARRRYPPPAAGRMGPRELLAALRRAAPDDRRARRFFLSNGLSCMGYGLPAAIGASLALERAPALCLTGDAGMAMVTGELELVTRLGTPVVTVVMNDGALDLIRLAQYRADLPAWGTEFGNPDFAQIARAYGILALRSGELDECEEAVREALHSRQPLLLDALIDPAGYSLPG